MSGEKILVVEDDPSLSRIINFNLVKNGYEVVTSADGGLALEIARKTRPDLIILDIMLPGIDGLEVCRILRSEINTPIIMLTARSEEMDKILGLEIGADDYITKPFSIREFLARIKAVLRRQNSSRIKQQKEKSPMDSIICLSGIRIDTSRHQVVHNGALLELTPKEFDLLLFFMSNPDRVFSRNHLLERVWGYDYAGDTRTVDVHVRWLREKIENEPAKPVHILTVRGVGYKFEA